jgi:hypothetical protein
MSLTGKGLSKLSTGNKTLLEDQVSAEENSLGLIDIEGGEFDVLTHELLKNLSACEIIVSMHRRVPALKAMYSSLLRRMVFIFDMTVRRRVEPSTVLITEVRSLRMIIDC